MDYQVHPAMRSSPTTHPTRLGMQGRQSGSRHWDLNQGTLDQYPGALANSATKHTLSAGHKVCAEYLSGYYMCNPAQPTLTDKQLPLTIEEM